MGTGDGMVLGRTKIVDNGPPEDRWNLVLVGDGYTAGQMTQYATDAQNFVDTLFATPPFSDLILLRPLNLAINVYRVDVTSTDSGADDPVACGGSGATPATYFDAAFCNGGIQRALVVNNATVLNVVNAQVPQWHMILVLVNTPIYGGTGGQVAVFSMAASANEIGLHEMGHTAFGLADEYEYYAGCGIDAANNVHPAAEPAEPNVTIDSNRATIKWRDLIDAATPMPTTTNGNCAVCDPQASPVPAGTVGAFEGAQYYHCACFRPEFTCRMRALGYPFCAVCKQRIRATLSPFMPLPPWVRYLDRFFDLRLRVNPRDWVVDPVPFDLVRFRRSLGIPTLPQARPAADDLTAVLRGIDAMDAAALRSRLLQVRTSKARLETAEKMLEAEIEKRQR